MIDYKKSFRIFNNIVIIIIMAISFVVTIKAEDIAEEEIIENTEEEKEEAFFNEENEEIVEEEIIEENIEEAEEIIEEELLAEELIEDEVVEEVLEEIEEIKIEVEKTENNNKYANILSSEPSVKGFVVRLYRNVLEREPDDRGFNNWVNNLNSKKTTASSTVKGFFLSEEMKKRNLDNETYVQILYRTILNREADSKGLQNWVDRLNVGMSREHVINGFLDSKEFSNLCKNYHVNKGGSNKTSYYRDKNYLVTSFVSRMYKLVLGRKADTTGLENWCRGLVNKSLTGADLVTGFFFSKEFINKKLDNTEFVEIAYRVILDREGETSGINSWVDQLNKGKSRRDILAGFVDSKEFSNLCKEYGIEKGSLGRGWQVENGKKYYYKNNGQKARKEVITIDGKRCGFNADGVYIGDKSNEYLNVYQKAINLVNQITNDSMTKEQKLRACFDIFATFREHNPWIPHERNDGWVIRYANYCFDNKGGNCINYGAAFAIMAQVLGYENVYACNSLGHGWAEIDNKVYDPEWTLHRPGNFFGRPLVPGESQNYLGAVDHSSSNNGHLKI